MTAYVKQRFESSWDVVGQDDLYRALLGSRSNRVPYRRKRAHKGETWKEQAPPTMQEVHRGVWCRRCSKRHPYNGSDRVRLVSQYEKRGKSWVLMWLCPDYGHVVGEIIMEGKRVPERELVVTRTFEVKYRVPLKAYGDVPEADAILMESEVSALEAFDIIVSVADDWPPAEMAKHMTVSLEVRDVPEDPQEPELAGPSPIVEGKD